MTEPKPDETVMLSVRVPKSLFEAVNKVAKRLRLIRSAYVRRILEQAVKGLK